MIRDNITKWQIIIFMQCDGRYIDSVKESSPANIQTSSTSLTSLLPEIQVEPILFATRLSNHRRKTTWTSGGGIKVSSQLIASANINTQITTQELRAVVDPSCGWSTWGKHIGELQWMTGFTTPLDMIVPRPQIIRWTWGPSQPMLQGSVMPVIVYARASRVPGQLQKLLPWNQTLDWRARI